MLQPVLRRDPFTKRKWYAFIPSDKDGTYWTRFDFYPPGANYLTYFTIQQVMFGIVRPGKTFFYGSAAWSESAPWSSLSYNGWNYRSTSVQGRYIDVAIPSGHNVIQFISYNQPAGSGAMLRYTWDGVSKDYDSGADGTGAKTITVTTTANSDGVKALRIEHNDTSGAARIVGVRSYNSNLVGDPSNASGGLALGDDLITLIDQSGDDIGGYHAEPGDAIDSTVKKIGKETAYEFAVKWAADGGTKKFTGGSKFHFGAGNAEFTYHSGEFATGPNIYVDGVAQNSVWDDVNNPVGKLFVGDNINIRCKGFADWDEDNVEDANEPDMSWTYNINASGIGIQITALINADTDVDAANNYSVMWKIPDGLSGYLTCPPSSTQYNIGSNQTLPGSNVALHLTGIPCEIRLHSEGMIKNSIWSDSSDKLYLLYDVLNQEGGGNPSAGVQMCWSGHLEVRHIIELSDIDVARLVKATKLLTNKAVQNKLSGAIDYYDDDGETVILTHTPTDGESEIARTPN